MFKFFTMFFFMQMSISALAQDKFQDFFETSFDCTKAHSKNEVLICSDKRLAELDYNLSETFWLAKKAAKDKIVFLKYSQESWRAREKSCNDKECLLRWYYSRKKELENTIQTGSVFLQVNADK
ncbi:MULTISPECIES: hypothetical protein [Enterobacter]|uniref:lysozyme inhibitor LprI family protein n=1 Tax=Enterobacter TaxID=547 RepID=UPI0010CA357C|nr:MULTISPECIES: hypothetical protein [Enterobacter]MCG7801107.1 hypothetical protein [Enterobacter asburiae]UAN16570.1 hypothetical protein KGP20_02095 [Enterobacter asburiae]UAN21466.1 hypothetical protein KGP25_20350 [Enterobacter sp. JBIWA003]UAN31191.1 hypothetical protein KGP22_18645 [Enterobacter sp. JBIWA005]BBJ69059.1 hypothetical protein ECC18A13_036240 [Enterobacter sp. 18A13]